MNYHALSVARHGGNVDLIGYLGMSLSPISALASPSHMNLESAPHPDVLENPNINIHALPPSPKRPKSIPFLVFAPWKVLSQTYSLVWLLAYGLPPAQWLLVQNPPSIPTLLISSFICYLRNTRLVIDWHNYGWTILAGTRGAKHPLVSLSKIYECYFGRLGSVNLTVTDAMGRQLRQPPYSIKSSMMTVHDRPAKIFQPLGSPADRKAVLKRIFPDNELISDVLHGRVKLIVSSTSWTPDEDFSLLLDALVKYAASANPPTPVLAVITGKGPQKDMYMDKIAALKESGALPNVTIDTAFLPFPDYAGLLACADLGVCLHMSSSGVDLPMKVVDMFGAGLPVAAYAAYESFGELVREGDNGVGFETADQLADILTRLLSSTGQQELAVLRKGAVQEGSRRWDEEWDATVAQILGLIP
jgi:beta-1,4-mannosyltransferase